MNFNKNIKVLKNCLSNSFYKNYLLNKQFSSNTNTTGTNTVSSGTATPFKQVVEISSNNIEITKNFTSIEIKLKDLEKYDISNKRFIFNTDIKIEELLKKMQEEFDIKIEIDQQSKFKVHNFIKYDSYTPVKGTFLTDINEIKKKLNLKENSPEYKVFLEIFEDQSKEKLNNLKRKFFFILAEIEKLEQTKELIDKKVNFRLNILWAMLIVILSIVTGIFYHCIYNVEDLGWDICEPVTYLFTSIIFIACLFGYIKLQKRSLYSSSHMYSEMKDKLSLKRNIIYNFNYQRYRKLYRRKENLSKEIERLTRI